jgi:hypothetical protein
LGKELDDLQEIARIATREALKSYEPIPKDWEDHLTLGSGYDGEDGIFELYVAAERPRDSIVISSARVNKVTRAAQVTVFHLQKKPTV